MQKWIQSPACWDHGLHRILSSYWLAYFYLMKKSAKVLLYFGLDAGCWDSLLTSRNPKNNWCLSRIFGARYGGKDRGWSTCKPWSQHVGGWIYFCMKRLRTLNSYQIFKVSGSGCGSALRLKVGSGFVLKPMRIHNTRFKVTCFSGLYFNRNIKEHLFCHFSKILKQQFRKV